MGKKRRRFSSEFKSKVALAAIRGEKSLAELASEFEIHANQVALWKRQLLEGAAGLFDSSRPPDAAAAEGREEKLYEQIGRLKMEVEWLKKKSAQFG